MISTTHSLLGRRLLIFGVLSISVIASAEQRLIPIGDRRVSINCDGKTGHSATVVLMAGGGRTAKDWNDVQPTVAGFTRVCSYDRAGLGDSEKTLQMQSVGEIVEDLHAVLQAAREASPYVLVAHSIAGIYARDFETRFPHETLGMVLLDSSHEEQAMRLQELLNPSIPAPVKMVELQGFFSQPGKRLQWQTDVPLVVLAHGKTSPSPGLTDLQSEAWERIWRELQQDLAMRSPHGQFRIADKSGHFIHVDQPDLVIQAIRDVSQPH